MQKCKKCGTEMEQHKAESMDGSSYNYLKCPGCGGEVLDMSQ